MCHRSSLLLWIVSDKLVVVVVVVVVVFDILVAHYPLPPPPLSCDTANSGGLARYPAIPEKHTMIGAIGIAIPCSAIGGGRAVGPLSLTSCCYGCGCGCYHFSCFICG